MEVDYGNKITELRKHFKLSQAAFAVKLGSTRGRISQIELNNNKPTLELLSQVINTFNVSADYFFHIDAPINSNAIYNSNEKMISQVNEVDSDYEKKDLDKDQSEIIINSLQDQIKTKEELIQTLREVNELYKAQLAQK